ncbi:hypothetical protein FRB98_003459 [Tulasnella sp. 332]|nr:hypothetical protein FRB98_003459 [Tulasnella sp. 332]
MFVPRSLTKKPNTTHAPRNEAVPSSAKPSADSGVIQAETSTTYNDEPTGKGKSKSVTVEPPKNTDTAQELAALLELSLSNYSLWCAPELRMIVETREDGWLSLVSLLRHSHLLQDMECMEQSCALALSAHGTGYLEVQMTLSSRSRYSNDYGLYNVRRNDWASISALELASFSEEYWEERTIYVENIPPPHRTHTHMITQFLLSILSFPSTPFYVEGLIFPGREGSEREQTKCRGFAFVVCGTVEEAEQALRLWSWDGISNRLSAVSKESVNDVDVKTDMEIVAAKARWTELKEEYFERRQQILALNSESWTRPASDRLAHVDSIPARTIAAPIIAALVTKPLAKPSVHDSFPRGCLLFVRNLHPETNKTTLKKLLNQAFGSTSSDGSELTYVDFTKGVDTCHIRTSCSAFASDIVNFFSARRILQIGALDDRGTCGDGKLGQQPIQMEIVDGRREEIYWEKVPEKTRLAAVSLAAQKINGTKDRGFQDECKKRKK